MNTMALVGISDHPIMEKKLSQNSANPWLAKASCSVLGSGLYECLTWADTLLFLRIALVVQFVIIGTIWSYLELTLMKNE